MRFDDGGNGDDASGPLFQQGFNALSQEGRSASYANAPLVLDADDEGAEPQTAARQEASADGSSALSAVETGRGFFQYRIEEGDNLDVIASKFSLEAQTIINNNPELLYDDYSEVGRQIIMLGTDGMLHTAKQGEDLFFIADLYQTPPEDIVSYAPNGLADADDLAVGDVLVVPGAVPPQPTVTPEELEAEEPAAVTPSASDNGTDESGDAPAPAPPPADPPPDSGSVSGWVWPVSGCGITRGVSGSHSGIDIDLFCNSGATVVAAASGTVIHAGWDGAYGNSVVIDHGNGLFSRYAHLSSVSVSTGQSVSAGQAIGVSGTTGNANGEHLHFEIRSGSAYGTVLNPMDYLP
ncbi:MAG TPA: LysM peptidoglycan-binding domain-containing M23 family metallopeptidase [Dehalococcoidia bacterium]|nr:LysM peptidoglycan-binding domain-containing M23 family metallopeptidase [Dehalococcoidia bacterium]